VRAGRRHPIAVRVNANRKWVEGSVDEHFPRLQVPQGDPSIIVLDRCLPPVPPDCYPLRMALVDFPQRRDATAVFHVVDPHWFEPSRDHDVLAVGVKRDHSFGSSPRVLALRRSFSAVQVPYLNPALTRDGDPSPVQKDLEF
jgi:hypothetical protein